MSPVIVTTPEELQQIVTKALDTYIGKISPATVAEPIEIINTETLCERLAITEPTAIRMRKRKSIPFFQVGSSTRYNWSAVIKALENKKG